MRETDADTRIHSHKRSMQREKQTEFELRLSCTARCSGPLGRRLWCVDGEKHGSYALHLYPGTSHGTRSLIMARNGFHLPPSLVPHAQHTPPSKSGV